MSIRIDEVFIVLVLVYTCIHTYMCIHVLGNNVRNGFCRSHVYMTHARLFFWEGDEGALPLEFEKRFSHGIYDIISIILV